MFCYLGYKITPVFQGISLKKNVLKYFNSIVNAYYISEIRRTINS